MTVTILTGDCLEVLPTLPLGSVRGKAPYHESP